MIFFRCVRTAEDIRRPPNLVAAGKGARDAGTKSNIVQISTGTRAVKLRAMTLTAEFRKHIASLSLPKAPALVAVSGGPDSIVLLDLLAASREVHGLELIVAHVDHGIHPDGARVAADVRMLGASYDLPVYVGELALGADAGETRARAERYAWLEALRSGLSA